ncbi:hypothetical protein [uncultured Helicobacter sp.]|uniref:hypothetical protein n=1 Tax=uncultured Helicobacter sp. TaxID=175537 RepID=UPI00374F0AC9
MTKDIHAHIPHFELISWDFSLDAHNNQIFMELNPLRPTCKGQQFCNYPMFGELSDEVFTEVARHYH